VKICKEQQLAEDPLKLEERRIWEWRNTLYRNLLKKPPGKIFGLLFSGVEAGEGVDFCRESYLFSVNISQISNPL
jgi:hypothetical protein